MTTHVGFNVAPGYAKGYCYQWWIFDVGAYVAQGAAGQSIMVVPGQDMVIVATGNMGDEWGTMLPDLACKIIIPAAHGSRALPADPSGAARLAEAIRVATQ